PNYLPAVLQNFYQVPEQLIPEFAPSVAFLLPGPNVPAQTSSQTQPQIPQRAPDLMTQRPTSDTSVTVSRQHLPQQQQEQQQQQRRLLQEMAMAYYAQSFLQQQQQQQQQNLAQQLYLHQHSSTLAPSQQVTGLLDSPFCRFHNLLFRWRPHLLTSALLENI
uniref:Protein muscleblind n=1 Tax=Mesocestoides corti TaxID=53468 RepID=A0A5K3G285_MESCO